MPVGDQLAELTDLLNQKRIPAGDQLWDAVDAIRDAEFDLIIKAVDGRKDKKLEDNLEKAAAYARQIVSGDTRKIEEFEKFIKARFKNETRKDLLAFCLAAKNHFDNHIDLEVKGNQYVKLVERNFGHPSDRIETVSGVGVVEVRGQRPYQEDAVLVDRSNAELLAKLHPEERKKVQMEAIASLQETVKDSGFVGSTVNLTTAWTEEQKDGSKNLRISNGNIGDSTAFVIILDKDGNVTQATLVNKLHNSDNPEEKERVENEKGFFMHGRVIAQGGGGVAVTRDIGGIEAKGLSRDPEITEETILIPPGGRAFVVAACDGLTERNLDEAKIGALVAAKANAGASPSAIAQDLMNEAYQQGSADNISVMVAEVDRPITLGIFDGHGGDIVSKKIAREMPQVLMKAMKISKPDVNAVKEAAKEKKADALVKRTEDLYKKQAKNLQTQILKHIAVMLKDPNLKATLQAAGITTQSKASEIMEQILTELSPPPGIPVDSLLLRLSEPFPTLITDYKTAVDKINILGHARYTPGEKLITLKQKLEEERIDKYLAMDVEQVRKVDLLKPGSFSRSLNSAVATSSLIKDTTDFYDDFYGKNISDIENFPDYPAANLKLQHEFFSVFDEKGHLSSEVKFNPDPRLDREPEPNFKGVTKNQRMKLEKFIQSSFSRAQSVLFDQGELRPWVYQKYGKTNIDLAISALGKEVVHSQLMAALLVQMSAGTMPDKYEKGGQFKGFVNTLIGSQALLNDRFVASYVKFKKAVGADLHGPAFERLEELSEDFYKKLQKNPCINSGSFAAILSLTEQVLALKGSPHFSSELKYLETVVTEFNKTIKNPENMAQLQERVTEHKQQLEKLVRLRVAVEELIEKIEALSYQPNIDVALRLKREIAEINVEKNDGEIDKKLKEIQQLLQAAPLLNEKHEKLMSQVVPSLDQKSDVTIEDLRNKMQSLNLEATIKEANAIGIRTPEYKALKQQIDLGLEAISSGHASPLALTQLKENIGRADALVNQIKNLYAADQSYTLAFMESRFKFNPNDKKQIDNALHGKGASSLGRMMAEASVAGHLAESQEKAQAVVMGILITINELPTISTNAQAHRGQSLFNDQGQLQPWVMEGLKLSETKQDAVGAVLIDLFKKSSELAYDSAGNLRPWVKDYINMQSPGAFERLEKEFSPEMMRQQILSAVIFPMGAIALGPTMGMLIDYQLGQVNQFNLDLIEFRKLMQTPEFANSEPLNELLAKVEQLQFNIFVNPAIDVSQYHQAMVAAKEVYALKDQPYLFKAAVKALEKEHSAPAGNIALFDLLAETKNAESPVIKNLENHLDVIVENNLEAEAKLLAHTSREYVDQPDSSEKFINFCSALQKFKGGNLVGMSSEYLKELDNLLLVSGDFTQQIMLHRAGPPQEENERLLEEQYRLAEMKTNKSHRELREALNREPPLKIEDIERIKQATTSWQSALSVYKDEINKIQADEALLKRFSTTISEIKNLDLTAAATKFFRGQILEKLDEPKKGPVFVSLTAMDQLLEGINTLAITAESKPKDKLAQTVYKEAQTLVMNLLNTPTADIKYISALAGILKASADAINQTPGSAQELRDALKAVKKPPVGATQLYRRGPHKEPKVKQELPKKIEAANAPKLEERKPSSRRPR